MPCSSNKYLNAISTLFSLDQNKIKLGLDRIEMLCAILGNPERQFPRIHVAGTNGKGSVCTKIERALSKSGYRVGLYTSPHIVSIYERIQINGVLITQEDFQNMLEHIFSLSKQECTFFEYLTALGFFYFAEKKVDIAVIETGLGGRYDATNIGQSSVSIITSIDFDHMDYLGTTLEAIAYEKAGIITSNAPVIIGSSVPFDVIAKQASLYGAPVYQVNSCPDAVSENTEIAKKALEILFKNMGYQYDESGLSCVPRCRFEEVPLEKYRTLFGSYAPKAVILDVAHNPVALKDLFSKIRRKFGPLGMNVVYAIVRDKDSARCMEVIMQYASKIYLPNIEKTRVLPSKELFEKIEQVDKRSLVSTYPNVEEALLKACQEASLNNRIVVVCGTFLIMDEAYKFFGIDKEA